MWWDRFLNFIDKTRLNNDSTENNYTDIRVFFIKKMFNELSKKGKLPFYLNPDILYSLKQIASVEDWDKQVDNETIENLYTIYKQWEDYLISSQKALDEDIAKNNSKIQKSKEWYGTWEQYKEAVAKNEIDEFTHVIIDNNIEENQSTEPPVWIEIDENGEIEEYME